MWYQVGCFGTENELIQARISNVSFDSKLGTIASHYLVVRQITVVLRFIIIGQQTLLPMNIFIYLSCYGMQCVYYSNLNCVCCLLSLAHHITWHNVCVEFLIYYVLCSSFMILVIT